MNGVIVSTKIKLDIGNLVLIKNKIEEYRKQRKEKQKVGFPNAGSVFKRGSNYISAELIEKAKLKGYNVGGAMVSPVHSGFIVNTGDATAQDVLKVIEHVKQVVYEKFEVNLELEIIVLGD